MALFRFTSDSSPRFRATGEGVSLRLPANEDFEEWAALRARSRDFLEPWEPVWQEDDLTRRAFRQRVKRAQDEAEADEAYAFLIFRSQDQALVGGVTLGLVRRGVAQACTMGYWIGEPFAGQGMMTRAVRVITQHAFRELQMRRIEAACLPTNERSRRLLERVGFQREGYAREYLCIAGRWQDHLLYAMLTGDLKR